MAGFSLTSRGIAVVTLAILGAPVATAARAGSAAQPGQTVGLPVGAQLPVGLYFVNLSSFGARSTLPRDSTTNVNLPTFAWATPWNVADARLQFFFTQPVAAASSRGAAYQSGIGQQLLAAQLAWDLGGDVGVSYLFGGYLPIQTRFLTQSASLTHRFAASYTGQDWNLTANLLYGVFLDTRAPSGTLYPDYLNLDLTMTRKFGKWQVGAVAYGSSDLPTGVGSYRPQGQIAVGGLVGYNFGPVNLQAYLTRDVVQRNYGGRETRGWLRAIVPLYQDGGEVEPNRTLVTRRQAE
ncbi:Putative MetA-pathway of phenol degradation [Methylobacterium phyllostachyos]|uniref:Putative MetA-pathway of phenol degradation n=1 Tax=Methylobacterium phyllostachyos TaxID=582672 RepID=A0A1G9XAL4_9HYPH|nr:transporter [Methylobacterium phyllostachyos]SDM93839.1 Putative MetA-pathway of phenol degradation [Methylobacterium phyllostachyos]